MLCVEHTISLCFRLKNEVGSYALMAGSGFDQTDFLQCCKFAEGDSRILMQKLSRDRFRMYQREENKAAAAAAAVAEAAGPAAAEVSAAAVGSGVVVSKMHPNERALCAELEREMAKRAHGNADADAGR